MSPSPTQSQARDAGMLRLIGLFLVVFALLVLLGLFWDQSGPERIVNLGAGLILLSLGVLGIAISIRIRKRSL